MKTASAVPRSLIGGIIRRGAAFNFHSGNVAPGGFVQHVFSLPAQSRRCTVWRWSPRRQSKNALYNAESRIMPSTLNMVLARTVFIQGHSA